MFRHIVLLSWTAEATAEQRAEVVSRLRTLPPLIAQLKRYEVTPAAEVSEAGFDLGVVADFDSYDDFVVYRDHPAHRDIIATHIKPILANRSAVQCEL